MADRPADLERMVASAVRHARESVLITDAELDPPGPRILYANFGFEAITGYTPEEVIGETPRILQGPETDRSVLDRLRADLAAGDSFHGEAINYRKDGTPFWLEWTISPVHGEHGRITHFVALQRDVTERKAAEAERLSFESKVHQSQRLESLGVFASGIAHDFNNVLTAVLGNASVSLRQLDPDAPVAQSLREIESAAQRGAELVRAAFDYVGHTTPLAELTDLPSIVRSMSKLLEACCSKRVSLEYELASPTPPIRGDRTELRQILMNLVTNASDSFGEAAGTVRIRTGSVDLDRKQLDALIVGEALVVGAYSFFEVTDDGVGISHENRERIFDPYFTTKHTGRGLGLAIVSGLVRGQGGAIELESQPGSGTRFRVLVPAAAGTAEHDDDAPRSGEDRAPAAGGGTVLFIDDEAGIRRFAVRALRGLGFEALTASDAREGLDMLRETGEPVLAIVLDLSMPGLSIEEAIVALQELRPDVPILITSGFPSAQLHELLTRYGVIGFLQKPFSLDELAVALGEALQ